MRSAAFSACRAPVKGMGGFGLTSAPTAEISGSQRILVPAYSSTASVLKPFIRESDIHE
jgi:hypothetical protein